MATLATPCTSMITWPVAFRTTRKKRRECGSFNGSTAYREANNRLSLSFSRINASHRSRTGKWEAAFITVFDRSVLGKTFTFINSSRRDKPRFSTKNNDSSEWLRQADVKANNPTQIVKIWRERIFRSRTFFFAILQIHENLGYILKGYSNRAIGSSLALLVLALIVCTQPTVAASPTDLPSLSKVAVELPPLPTEFPPLRDLSLPSFEKVVLNNGLRVFLLEDHELGLVGGQLLVKGGNKSDPVEKLGLAAMTSLVQRSGGSLNHPAVLLDTELEAMAARIETASSVSQMSVAFRCLREDLIKVISLFSEVVQQPLMPQEKLELTRSQFLGAISRRGDDAQSIAAREFPKLLYGNESVYSRYPVEDTITAISQKDLLAFHRELYNPSMCVLGIWGDFDKSLVKAAIEENFSSWNGDSVQDNKKLFTTQTSAQSDTEVGPSISEPYVYTIDYPGLSQGFVRMGELGTTLADPDIFALDLLNDILNGFGGLLFDQVRSREGLAYSVYGGWTPAVEHRGSFMAGGETRIDSVADFVQAVKKVFYTVTQVPPAEELLAKAKEGVINSFVFNFVDSGAQLSRIMTYELFGIDQDFLLNYKERVEELTSNEILQAAQQHLHPNSQPILIVSDVSKLSPFLQSLKVKVISLQPNYMLNK